MICCQIGNLSTFNSSQNQDQHENYLTVLVKGNPPNFEETEILIFVRESIYIILVLNIIVQN